MYKCICELSKSNYCNVAPDDCILKGTTMLDKKNLIDLLAHPNVRDVPASNFDALGYLNDAGVFHISCDNHSRDSNNIVEVYWFSPMKSKASNSETGACISIW
jgi:hypothetical protein